MMYLKKNINDSNNMVNSTTKRNAYSELNPIFKELVSHLQENGSIETIHKIKKYLSSELNSIKQTYNKKETNARHNVGKFVSSNSNYAKKRKTYGTSYHNYS